MSYFRPMGDPITSPSQVDDGIVVAPVPPTIVGCADLPADSPWRRPGEVCAPPSSGGIMDYLRDVIRSATSPTTTTPTPTDAPGPPDRILETANIPGLLLLAALGGGAYYLLKKKKRS